MIKKFIKTSNRQNISKANEIERIPGGFVKYYAIVLTKPINDIFLYIFWYSELVYWKTIKNRSKRVYDHTTPQFGFSCCHFTDAFLSLLNDVYEIDLIMHCTDDEGYQSSESARCNKSKYLNLQTFFNGFSENCGVPQE